MIDAVRSSFVRRVIRYEIVKNFMMEDVRRRKSPTRKTNNQELRREGTEIQNIQSGSERHNL